MTRITDILAARMDRVKKGDKGFTLIELLVVVIIIGILAAIAIPVYIGVQNNAKDSAVKSDLGNAKTAVVAFFTANNGSYPATVAPPATGGTPTTSLETHGYPGPSIDYSGNGAAAPAWSGTAPTTNASAFCISATSPTGGVFFVTASGGVKKVGENGATLCS